MIPEIDPAVGQLRELGRADIPELQALFERCTDYFALHEGRPPTSTEAADDFDRVPDGMPRSHRQAIGLYAPGLVAVAEILRDWRRPGTWTIALLLLDPAIRRRGVGAHIVEAVASW
jgi:GNAT superfamily N-acetyltransferase